MSWSGHGVGDRLFVEWKSKVAASATRQKLCGAVRWYRVAVVQRLWRRRLIPETRVRSPVATHLLTSLNLPVSSLATDSNWIPVTRRPTLASMTNLIFRRDIAKRPGARRSGRASIALPLLGGGGFFLFHYLLIALWRPSEAATVCCCQRLASTRLLLIV